MVAAPVLAALHRRMFRLSVFSGLRASRNRAWSRRLSRLRAADCLQDPGLRSPTCGALQARVHARSAPHGSGDGVFFGMISVRRERPPVAPLLYGLLCRTSHFGDGEFEVAFFEEQADVTLYASRAIAHAHAQRLGWHRTARRLAAEWDDVEVLRLLTVRLREAGFQVHFAAPRECIRLALDRRLVRPARLDATVAALERKYRRLNRALALPTAPR